MKKLLLTLLLVPMIGFGQNNYSINFDGQDDYIELTDIDLLQDFSISAWIKTDDISSYQNIVSKYVNPPEPGGYALIISDQGNFYAHTGLGATPTTFCATNTLANINQWNHISLTLDAGLLSFYLNGQFIHSCNGLNNSPNTTSNTFIGKAAHGWTEMFDGLIDDVSIWNTPLTQQEIQQYMNCSPTGTETGLVGYWNFEEGSGTTAYDLTSNGNNGTINGATYSTDVPVQNCCTPTSSIGTHTACNSFTWLDGTNYTASNNSATYTTINAEGCDSTITLDLTINSFTQSSIIETSCGSYTAPDGQVYSSSGNYTATIPNISGCDSIISIDLSINPSTSSTDTQTACDSYSWIDGNTYTSSNNTAIYSIPNGTNCDSVITLDLTINTTPANTVIQNGTALTATQTSATYQWIDCDDGNAPIVGEVNQTYFPSTTGNYAVIVTVNGCSNTSECYQVGCTTTTSSLIETACESYTAPDGQAYTSTGSYSSTIPNAAGCDSVISIDLTINPLPSNNVTQNGAFLTAGQTGATYQWIDCDNFNAPITGEINQFFNPTSTGSYAVIVTVNGCSSTSECRLVDFTNLNELNTNIITLHPNPTSDILIISGLNKVSGVRGLEITSSKGDIIRRLEGTKEEIDVSMLESGIYFLNINHDKGVETIRFIKQ